MKYVTLALLLSLPTSQVFALAENALESSEQGVEIVKDPEIKLKANHSSHDEKPTNDVKKKLFVKKNSSPNNLNVSSSKEEASDKLDLYHIELKKVGESFEKVEKLVEVDKSASGEKIIKKVVKCGGGGTKHQNKCQAYNHNFCQAMIDKKLKIEALREAEERGDQSKIDEIKNVYQQHDVKDVKPEIVSKLNSFANDSKEKSGVNLSEAIKQKLNENRLASHPMPNVDYKKKFKEDLAECQVLISSFKPTQEARPNNESRAASATQQ